jgi:hypothetical protein
MINEPCEIRTQPLGIYLFLFYIEGPMIGALTRCLVQSLASLLRSVGPDGGLPLWVVMRIQSVLTF